MGLEPLHPLIDRHGQSRLQQPYIVRVRFGFSEHLRQIDRTCLRNGVHHTQRRVTVRPRPNLGFRYSQPTSQLISRDARTPQDRTYRRTACHDLIVIACTPSQRATRLGVCGQQAD